MTMLKKTILSLAAVAALSACQASAPGGSKVIETAPATGVARAMTAGNALSLTSQQRARHGLGALRQDARLQRAAQVLANHMARQGRIGHEGPGGSRMADRMKVAGYTPCFGVENVAFGQNSPAEVVRAWMESPGHRKNMLDGRAADAGIAMAVDGSGYPYWAMVAATHCR